MGPAIQLVGNYALLFLPSAPTGGGSDMASWGRVVAASALPTASTLGCKKESYPKREKGKITAAAVQGKLLHA